MRFLFVDRIIDTEPGKYLVATRSLGVMDGYFGNHYPHLAVVPLTVLIECLAQAGGWLNVISRDFSVKTVLALVEGVEFHVPAQPGDMLTLDVRMRYQHYEGATMSGQARRGSEVLATVDRLVFAHRWTTDADFIRERRRSFTMLGGRLLPVDGAVHASP
jgi:3-hydroxyacyl-[acyl-carrier-protein] dehydratase